MHALKLIRIDGGAGLVLPKDVLAKLGRGAGDTVYLIETAEGLLLSPHDPALQGQIDAGREFIDDYAQALRALTE
ncbi:MAG TPA: AbrB/MazE/SpoVT family DNA-binding domain-containing protein [Noviherbaspirillum sp.]|uniref:AbrB/MazE/SpoVT family DNA-binding domain-containing protein n=1 Tax=Noviherbaspirillum sp. TaxID=1926288 RepID=UPI002B487050|nr:AbrB/MazE/SpoVT family DNA-binding domain-containing protein [Noviherbaspirillum sp.]HJV84912.1 AbrB/MazE/SpoVT family DNA-binding domain-containing protein [Noviherbaspirillum sp.]